MAPKSNDWVIKSHGDRLSIHIPRRSESAATFTLTPRFSFFSHGNTETTVFGSCNASEPALMGPNTETVIVLPPAERGRTAKKLGLDSSIRGASAFKNVAAKKWPEDER